MTHLHPHTTYTHKDLYLDLCMFLFYLLGSRDWHTHTQTQRESESLFGSTFFPNCTPDCHSYGLQALEYRAELSNNHNRFINLYLTCNQYNKLHKAYSLNDSIDFILQNCSTEIRICFKLCGFFFFILIIIEILILYFFFSKKSFSR